MSYGDLKAKVRAMCARPEGVSLREASNEIGRADGVASVYFGKMRKNGEIIQAGVHLKYRYFTDPVAAEKYDREAKAKLLKQMAESKERRRINKVLRERERRKQERAKNAELRKNACVAAVKKLANILAPKPLVQRIVLENKQQAIQHKREHQKAQVVWPDNVVVEVVTSPDRYAIPANFEGEFMQEWKKRRA